MITVHIKNSRSQITGDAMIIHTLREKFKHRAKNYYWNSAFREGRWDGYVRYITETGGVATGHIPKILEYLDEEKVEYKVDDRRDLFRETKEVTKLADMLLRDYQLGSVRSLLNNKLKGLRFQRGILWDATNAGKNIIASAIFTSFSKKRTGIMLINNQVIHRQLVKELGEFLGEDQVGEVSSKVVNWKRLTVCMVQTLAKRVETDPRIRQAVASVDILLVDEADDVINRKDAKKILAIAHNAPVRVALTGTAGLSKDQNKNENLVGFFGPVVHQTTNKELVDLGHSAKPIIKIHEGNTLAREDLTYFEAYEELIINNKDRHKKVWKRVKYAIKRDRFPVLVLIQYHRHARALQKAMPKSLKGYRTEVIHSKVKNRDEILDQFNEGKIDILICSMIIRRGKNAPLIRTLINAAGGDDEANLLQIFGRGLRKKAGIKETIYIDDFYDLGKYLARHSKHRVIYYKKQKFKVRELYDKLKHNKTTSR